MGGKRRGDEKWDSQGGRKWEKKGKIMQHRAIFCNRKNAKRKELQIQGGDRD